MTNLFRSFHQSNAGNVAIMSAFVAPLFIGVLSLSADYAAMTLQRRQMQSDADLAAIEAAAQTADPTGAVKAYFVKNGKRVVVDQVDSVDALTIDYDNLETAFEQSMADGMVKVVVGNYRPDLKIDPDDRFSSSRVAPNAVAIRYYQRASIYFASSFTSPPTMTVTAVASNRTLAAFSIGSRLASVNGGALNKVLTALIGASVDLNVMDYNALATAKIDLLSFSRALASEADISALTFSQILQNEVSWPQLLRAAAAASNDLQVKTALQTLDGGAKLPKIKLSRLIDLGDLGALKPADLGETRALSVQAGILDVITSSLALANEKRQISFALDGAVPGLGAIKVDLAIGERMVSSPAIRVGERGSIVRTAQTRLYVEVTVPGLNSLAGVSIHVPLYVEAAFAEAQLSNLTCGTSPATDTAEVKAKPGIARLYLGEVNKSDLTDFKGPLAVARAQLVTTPLVSANGFAEVESTNLAATNLRFSADDIEDQRLKSVSTKNAVETLVTSALSQSDLQVKLAGVSLTPLPTLNDSLAKSPTAAAGPLDELINTLSSTLGLQIGEADVRVSQALCERSYLVQ